MPMKPITTSLTCKLPSYTASSVLLSAAIKSHTERLVKVLTVLYEFNAIIQWRMNIIGLFGDKTIEVYSHVSGSIEFLGATAY